MIEIVGKFRGICNDHALVLAMHKVKMSREDCERLRATANIGDVIGILDLDGRFYFRVLKRSRDTRLENSRRVVQEMERILRRK